MSRESDLETLSDLVRAIQKGLSYTNLPAEHCLFATTLVMAFAERLGFEVERWEGSVVWQNRKYREISKKGYDFIALSELPEPKREQRLQALERRGMRTLHCLANEGDPVRDLGGHLCVIARRGERGYFIDPTSHQFQRSPAPPERPGAIDAPSYIVTDIDIPPTAEINYAHGYKGGLGLYYHSPVTRYRAMQNLSEQEFQHSGLNPMRDMTLYRSIESYLGLAPLTQSEERGE